MRVDLPGRRCGVAVAGARSGYQPLAVSSGRELGRCRTMRSADRHLPIVGFLASARRLPRVVADIENPRDQRPRRGRADSEIDHDPCRPARGGRLPSARRFIFDAERRRGLRLARKPSVFAAQPLTLPILRPSAIAVAITSGALLVPSTTSKSFITIGRREEMRAGDVLAAASSHWP